jgi:hypothetical protein
MDQSNEKTLYKHVYYNTQNKETLKISFATTTALDINSNANNSPYVHQHQCSLGCYSLSNSYIKRANLYNRCS